MASAKKSASSELDGASEQLDPVVEPPPARRDPTPMHFTRCTVVGSDVVSMDRTFVVGTVADFPNSDVASLPDHLIPVTE